MAKKFLRRREVINSEALFCGWGKFPRFLCAKVKFIFLNVLQAEIYCLICAAKIGEMRDINSCQSFPCSDF